MKSFAVNLEDLHCTVHFLMIDAKTHKLQVKKAVTDLKKQKYPIDGELVSTLDQVFKDCKRNPGFTFQISDTDVVVCLREEFFREDRMEYFVGIAAHEISHAVNFIMVSLGINIDDDELRAIEIGNIVEEFAEKTKIFE